MEGGTKAEETNSVAGMPRPVRDSERPGSEELASLVASSPAFHDSASETLDFDRLGRRFFASPQGENS